MRPAGHEAGFTLVELLVSLALLGLAAVLVGQGLGSDHAALGRIERRTRQDEMVVADQTLVRNRLEHLFAEPRYDSLNMFVDFDGQGQELQFLASGPSVSGGGPSAGVQVQRFRLGLLGDDLAFGPILVSGASTGVEPPTRLTGVRALDIAYWGPSPSDPTPAWRPDWSRRNAPPQLVRVRVAFAPGDRRTWPELIVRPAAMVDADCIYDPDRNVCRGQS